MDIIKLVAVASDNGDWIALYNQDGHKVVSGHSISWAELAMILGIEVTRFEVNYEKSGFYGHDDTISSERIREMINATKASFEDNFSDESDGEWYQREIEYLNSDIDRLSELSF